MPSILHSSHINILIRSVISSIWIIVILIIIKIPPLQKKPQRPQIDVWLTLYYKSRVMGRKWTPPHYKLFIHKGELSSYLLHAFFLSLHKVNFLKSYTFLLKNFMSFVHIFIVTLFFYCYLKFFPINYHYIIHFYIILLLATNLFSSFWKFKILLIFFKKKIWLLYWNIFISGVYFPPLLLWLKIILGSSLMV